MEKDFDWSLFIDRLWERENAKGKKGVEGKGGYRKGKYYPYEATNGKDIGPGLDLSKQTDEFRKRAEKGLTKKELDTIVRERLEKEKKYFNQRIAKEGGDTLKIPENVYGGLYDMYWQIGNGLYQNYPKFWKGVAQNDYDKMQKESATYYEPKKGAKISKDTVVKNGKVLDEGRWNFRKQTYFNNPGQSDQSTTTPYNDGNLKELVENLPSYEGTPMTTPYNDGWLPGKKADGGPLNTAKIWNDLSVSEKSEMMKAAIRNGITNLNDIKGKYNEFAIGGPEEKDKSLADNIRKRLYYNITPRGYENAVPRLFDAVLDKRQRSSDTPNLEALWAKYLGLNDEDFRSVYKDFPDDRVIQYPLYPRISDYVQESKYTPSDSKDKDARYYSLAFPEISNWEIDQFLTSADKRGQTQGYNDTMGTFTLTKGRDDRGDYISYYDKWDVSPFRGYGAKHDEGLGIGKPVELYDRLYLDDYYNNPQSPADYWSKGDYYGGYLPEVIVTATGEPADLGLRRRNPTPDNIGLGTFGRQNPVNRFDGTEQPTQQMDRGNQPLYDGQIGFGFGYNPETFERYYTGFYNPYNNSYNNATWTDENDEYNIGLPTVTIRPSGESMVNRAQEKAAPVVRDVLLGSAALAGGIPALANAASKVPLAALKPGGAFWTNPLTQQMAAGTLVGTASDAASTAITGRPVGKVMSDVINNITGWDSDDNVFSRAAVDMMNPFYYTPYGVASKGVNTAVNVARIASPKYRALHAYNSVNPVGYDNIIKRGKDWLIDMVQDNYVDLKNPKFYRDLVSQANGVRPKFGYTGTGSYLGKNIKNAGQIADEARLDAWAIHNRLAPQYGTYRKNPDGSWSYDMDNIVRKSENTWYPEVAPKSTKKTGALDFVTGAGGGLTDFRLVGSDSKGNGLMHIEDLWDVNPFKRIGDKLTARVFPNLSKKISDKTWSKALNLEVYGLENPDTWAGRVASKLAPKLYKASEKPFLGLLSPIDNAMSKFEIGMVTGGKPFLMKTDIPFHKNPEFGIRFKEMMDDPSKMKFFDTPVYNYGYNPDYIVNLEKAEPMLNFNVKDIDWNKLRLTEPVNSVSIK